MLGFVSFFAIFWSLAAALTQHCHDASFVPDATLHVTAKNISAGGIYRYTTLINGTAPGPPLHLPEGKVVWIRVYNDMDDRNTTVHWHGLSQAAYPFSDGTPLASQWPIPPGHYFDYELQLQDGSAGTYFYHAHVGFQASSAAGPLIIEDSGSPPYHFDGHRTVFLSELWNKSDTAFELGLYNKTFKWSGESLAFLVNGKGISNYSVSNPETANVDVIHVEPSKAYRMRFIGGTTLSLASMAFENHTDLQIIEADGDYTKPAQTSFLQMGPGQRYSLLFKTKSCDELRKLGKTDYYLQIETRDRPSMDRDYAILRYKDTCGIKASRYPTNAYPKQAVLSLPQTDTNFLEYKLRPLKSNNFPTSKDVTRRVIINMQQVLDGFVVWQDDLVTWYENQNDTLPGVTIPREPYLVALYKNQTQYLPNYSAAVANGGVDPKTQTYPAKIGEVLEIILQNYGAKALDNETAGGLDSHPWHMHGKHFYDIGSGNGKWDANTMEAQLAGSQPVLRDTTMVYRYNATTQPSEAHGWRAWRLRVEQPGVWMLHCHSLQHMIMGMQTVWVMGDAEDILKVPRPEVEGFLTYGGNVYGNETHYPTRIHFSEMNST